jgi:hypothetical protein
MGFINRQGITRLVFITNKYAIKVPRINRGWKRFIEGMCSNMSENQCWNACESEYLCPVLFSFGGFVLVMPKLEILKRGDSLPKIHTKEPGCDPNPINYGYLNGKIVCVDYPYHRIKPYRR